MSPLFAIVTGLGVFALAKKSAQPAPAAAEPTTDVRATLSGPDGAQSTAGGGAPVVAVAATGAGLPKTLAAPTATVASHSSVAAPAPSSRISGKRPYTQVFQAKHTVTRDHRRGQGTAAETQVAIRGALGGLAPDLLL